MPIRIGNVTFDCDDVLKVGAFWAEALGGRSTLGVAPGSPPSVVTILSGPSPLGTSRRFRSRRWRRTACTWTWSIQTPRLSTGWWL